MMPIRGFRTPLVVEVVDDGEYRLTEPFQYETAMGTLIEVPVGFVTDFASVPRLPVVYSMYGGRASKAAVIHDYLTRQAGKDCKGREYADNVFLEAMYVSGIPHAVALPFYQAVRLHSQNECGDADRFDTNRGTGPG